MSELHDQEKDPKPPWTNRLPSFDVITKALGLLAIAFYSIGLVVQNQYLASLGVTDFELLRARSIVTGILCAVLVTGFAIPILVVYLAVFGNEKVPPKVRARYGWISLGICFIGAPVALYLFVSAYGERPPISFLLTEAGYRYFQLPIAGTLSSLYVLVHVYNKAPLSKEDRLMMWVSL
jgi:hypothetical protein